MSDLRIKILKSVCKKIENRFLSAIKRNEPFCSLDLTRYFLTEKKNLCQIKKWRELQKRKLDFLNEYWVKADLIQISSRSIPKTKSTLRAILEIMPAYHPSGKSLV